MTGKKKYGTPEEQELRKALERFKIELTAATGAMLVGLKPVLNEGINVIAAMLKVARKEGKQ